MTIFLLILIGFVLLLLYVANQDKKEKERALKLKESCLLLIEDSYSKGEINENQKNDLLSKIENFPKEIYIIPNSIHQLKIKNQREKEILEKYGKEIGRKISNNEFWIGMTEEQLIDSRGTPTKIENQVLKTKTKTTMIYGTKSGGDVFIIENGLVVKFTDR